MNPTNNFELSGKFKVVAEVTGNSIPFTVTFIVGDEQNTLNTSPYEWEFHSKDLLSGENVIRVEILDMKGSLIDFDEIIVFAKQKENSDGKNNPSDDCSPVKLKSGKC